MLLDLIGGAVIAGLAGIALVWLAIKYAQPGPPPCVCGHDYDQHTLTPGSDVCAGGGCAG